MRKRLLFIVCIVMTSLLSSTAFAAVIGSYTVTSGTVHSDWDINWLCNLTIARGEWSVPRTTLLNGADADDRNSKKGVGIFGNIARTFWLSSNQDDPEYSLFVSKLTDNIGESVYIEVPSGTYSLVYRVPLNELTGMPEQYGFPYLQGYTIDRIGLSIDSASHTIDYTAMDPHIYKWQLTLTIEGNPPVPEPASLTTLMMGIGGLGIGFCKRRWNSRDK